jgi:hypothetical protein
MDHRTILRELDELIRRTQSVIERETALQHALPRSRLWSEKQQRLRSMRTQLRRLRNQRSSMATRRALRTKIA